MYIRKSAAAAAITATLAIAGCGSGAIFFDEIAGSPPQTPPSTFHTFDIDCKDEFQASGGQTALGRIGGPVRQAKPG